MQISPPVELASIRDSIKEVKSTLDSVYPSEPENDQQRRMFEDINFILNAKLAPLKAQFGHICDRLATLDKIGYPMVFIYANPIDKPLTQHAQSYQSLCASVP